MPEPTAEVTAFLRAYERATNSHDRVRAGEPTCSSTTPVAGRRFMSISVRKRKRRGEPRPVWMPDILAAVEFDRLVAELRQLTAHYRTGGTPHETDR